METERVILGRPVGPKEVALVRSLLAEHPDWHRTQLSRELCRRWEWRNAAGQPKDMACRTLLLRLERMGLIVLPARRGPSVNGCRNRDLAEVPYCLEPVACALEAIQPVGVEPLDARHADQALFRLLLARHHYLGLRRNAGQNLRYLARDRQGRPLACLLFGTAAWKAQARDRFIGWDDAGRRRGLARVVDNSRFLILPWVRVPHLASHLLGRVARRIDADWRAKYGHGVELLETFVDRARFRGTCYRAAGWFRAGATTGRGRNDLQHTLRVPAKDVYVLALREDFRLRLCAPADSLPEGRVGR